MRNRSFGGTLKEARIKKGLSINQAAKLTGYSKGYLSELETGKKANASIKTCEDLAAAYEMDLEDLLALLPSRWGLADLIGNPNFSFSRRELTRIAAKNPEQLDAALDVALRHLGFFGPEGECEWDLSGLRSAPLQWKITFLRTEIELRHILHGREKHLRQQLRFMCNRLLAKRIPNGPPTNAPTNGRQKQRKKA